MVRASSWLGCVVEGAAESGRRAMKDASVVERTGTGPFHISPACRRAVAESPARVAANHPEQPPWGIFATPMSPCGAWPEPLPGRRCSPFRLTSAHQPVGHGWPYWALSGTGGGSGPVARRVDRQVDWPDET